MRRLLALILKELIAAWRDPKSRFSILLPPITQLLIFTFAATLDVKNVSIGILNRDNGEQGFELVERFHGSPTFSHVIHLNRVEEITPFINEQKGIMVLSLDQHFSRDLDAKRETSLQLILDGRKSNTAQIVAGYAQRIIEQFETDYTKKQALSPLNTRLIPRNYFNPNLLYHWYNVASLAALLSMLTCLVVTANSIARERELGTFDQLLVSPLLPTEVIAGKIIPGILIGLIEGTIIVCVGVFLFQVPFTGSVLLFYACLTVFVAAISGVGLFISSLCSTQQQAILGAFIFMVPSVILSGFATPIENMPHWLQPVTYIMPLRYMLVISKGSFLKAMPPSIILTQLWPMVVIGFFNLIACGLFVKRRLT